jgi:ABC-type bacteriocin/lantibiotic exporter with double-glycine peptidase domain
MKFRLAAISAIVLAAAAVSTAAAPEGKWIDVPYVRQQRNGCGAACVAMVMQYWNKARGREAALDSAEILRALYNPDAHGVYASRMESYLREHGFRTFAFRGTMEDLRQHLADGRPLIVCLAPGGRGAPLHYVVVAGFNPAQQTILVNDPARRKLLAMDRARFTKEWAAAQDWTLLAVPR